MANEKRQIDAETVIRKLRNANCAECNVVRKIQCSACWVDDVVSLLEDAPTVDAVEVVHAYWIKHDYAEEENGLLVPNYECSACHSWERDEGYYCPNCGAKMDGGNEDG